MDNSRKISGDFCTAAQKAAPGKPQELYHCMYQKMEPDPRDGSLSIRTSLGYGTHIPAKTCAELGIPDKEKKPLVFASDHLSKTLAFAFAYSKGEIFMNGPVDGTRDEWALVPNRDHVMNRAFEATVYSFPSKGFASLTEGSRQYVSAASIPLAETKIAKKIENAEDMMRSGLQLFTLKESMAELGPSYIHKAMQERNTPSPYELLSSLIKEKIVVWENHARGINPNPALAETLGIELGENPQQKKDQSRKPSSLC